MRFVGAKVQRVEDRRILTGRGHYVDDVQLPEHAPRRLPAQSDTPTPG